MTEKRTLPEGWRWVRFGDVVRQVKDRVDPETAGLKRYVAGEHMDTDDLVIRRWGDVGDGYLGPAFHRRFQPGNVLYGSRRTYLRKVAVPDFEGICANTTFVLEPNSEDLLPGFLPYVMSTDRFHAHSIQQSKGSVNPYVNFRDLVWYEFPLPPIEQQRMLKVLLCWIEESREMHNVVSENASVVAEALIERAIADARWVALEEVLLEPPRNGLTIVPTSENTGIQSLTVGSASKIGYSPYGAKWIEQPRGADRFRVNPGDLFVTRSNTIDRVGLPLVVPDSAPSELYYSDLLMRLRPDPSMIPVFLLERFMRTRRARMFFQSIAAGTSASMKKINGRNLKTMPVPILDSEQVSCLHKDLTVLTAFETTNLESATNVTRIRQALLQDLTRV
jgi:type I restriction enzyme S subunit